MDERCMEPGDALRGAYNCDEKCAESRPSATTMIYGHEKARQVTIEQLDFGYKVNVGCQVFAIQSLDTVVNLLTEYLKSPGEVETKWRKGELKF